MEFTELPVFASASACLVLTMFATIFVLLMQDPRVLPKYKYNVAVQDAQVGTQEGSARIVTNT